MRPVRRAAAAGARGLVRAWDRFWFAEIDPTSAALFRIALGLLWLSIILASFPNWQRFYGPDGIAPLDQVDRIPGLAGGRFSIFAHVNALGVDILYWATLAVTAAFLVGFRTRVATIALYLLVLSMVNRTPTIVHGEDLVSRVLLFFACFAPLGERFSVDDWLRRRRGTASRERIHAWSIRLIQLGALAVYIFSLPAKPSDDRSWLDGSAIYYVMASSNWGRFQDLVPLFYAAHGLLSKLFTDLTLWTEGLFPILVWIPRVRLYAIGAITLLHLGVGVLVKDVMNFNLVMLAAFILFVPGETWVALLTRASARLPRRRMPETAATATT